MSNREQQFKIAIRKFSPFEAAIQKQWTLFAQQTGSPLQLYTEALDLQPLEEQLFANGGLKNGSWDVAFISTDWLAQAHQADALVDLTPYLAANPPDDFAAGWSNSLLRMQRFGEVTLGLPYHDGPEVLIYRQDLFDDAAQKAAFERQFRRPLTLPATWEEFRQLAHFFTRPADNLYGTVFAAYPDGHNTVYDFCLQLWTRGGQLLDASGAVTLDSAEAAEALTFYRELLNDSAAIHPQSRQMDSVQSGLALMNGEVALAINWFGFASMCETLAESKVKGKIAIAPIPRTPPHPSVSLNVYWVLAIGSGSPHPDMAYQFIRFCASAAMDKLMTLEGGIGCRKSTWRDPDVNDSIPFYQDLEHLHENARELPRHPEWPKIAHVIDEMMLGAINTDAPIRQLLKTAEQKARALFG